MSNVKRSYTRTGITKAKRGLDHFKAKHPFSVVEEARGLYESWKEVGSKKGYQELAAIYDCSPWTVRDWVTYRTRISA